MAEDRNGTRWWALPEHVLPVVYSWLEGPDRYNASLTCRHWSAVFDKAVLWRHFSFNFQKASDGRQLLFLESHGNHLKSVNIFVNPQVLVSQENLCKVLMSLARSEDRKLERIGIYFTSENPLFFQGSAILSSLAELFGPPAPGITLHSTLREVDLSGLNVSYTDILFNLLASTHPNLEVLNIQNTSLSCQVTPFALLQLVKRCRRLQKLWCFYKSMCDEIMDTFVEDDRRPLEFLSLSCQREDKFHKHLSDGSWDKVSKQLPKLRVSFLFDHTIERLHIHSILHHQIPLVELSLRTLGELHREVALVDSFFSPSLERLTITTKGSTALEEALVTLVENAARLRALHCYCGLREEVIARIKELRPDLEECTLHTEESVEGIVIGREARANAMDVRNYLQVGREEEGTEEE